MVVCVNVLQKNLLEELKEFLESVSLSEASRKESEQGIPTTLKDDDTYFLGGIGGDNSPLTEEEKIVMSRDAPLLQEFIEIIKYWNCIK